MTGTSMDGIDISFVRTNGISLERLDKNIFYPFNNKIKELFLNISNKNLNFNLKRKSYLDKIITEEHYQALKTTDFLKSCDLIGFHGQTIYHNPEERVSIQIGDAQKLSNLTNKNVVFDFRKNDIEMGGQGAPLAPIYHKFIIESLNLELPSCILNIGGISNLTYWDGKTLIGFDTGPGNTLMDNYMKLKYNKFYDENGTLASSGIPNKELIKKFLSHKYFKTFPPKSLDKNSFIYFYKNLLKQKLDNKDKLATLLELTIQSILASLKLLPKKTNNIMVTGGGSRNTFLMKQLKNHLPIKFLNEEEIGLNFDYIESELIAYLSARSIYKLPFTFPSTTGVQKPLSGGKLYEYL